MKKKELDKLYQLLDNLESSGEDPKIITEIKDFLDSGDYPTAIRNIQQLLDIEKEQDEYILQDSDNPLPMEEEEIEEDHYPQDLSNDKLEKVYISLLLNNPKLIAKYYFLFEDCFFENPELLNIYKSILFTEGSDYAPEFAKRGFNFAKKTEEVFKQIAELKKLTYRKDYNIEKVYVEMKKLFLLRKTYRQEPLQEIQNKIVEITNYELYNKMSVTEVESAIEQVSITGKFKQAILNKDLTTFLEEGDNNLTNGLSLPFSTLTKVFKGIRKGETMAIAMPSNAGKSRLTIHIATHTALVEKKKVLIISNEMSEEKMKLCLITTILNHPEIQKLHGQILHKTEGELLEFKFRPDDPKKVKVDENGFVIKEEKETRKEYIQRLSSISSEFNKTIIATNWVNKQINNSIYFINITDHTNEELQNVIMNYYYKEKIEYIFYDTLKTDTANIGNGEELKKTATILSNLAQNFNIYICSTLQLAENSTLPINLDINDLAVSRTVKEVLDTLCLMKQINRNSYDNYEYSLEEVSNEFYDIEKVEDPDVRYYSCVVDKNRAGAKPRLVFKLNLAYNSWEELGFLRLKQNNK